MATNSLLTDAKITKESMAILHNTLGFVKGVDRQYSKEFGNTGAKIGVTINVRKPNRYTVQQGPAITPQGQSESSVPLTLNRQWVVPMTFSTAELTLSIDEFSKRYIQPAISKLASQIDLDCAYAAIKGTYLDGVSSPGAGPVNTVIGTPGTTPGTPGGTASGLLNYNAPNIFLNAGLVLDNNAAPRDKNRVICLNPAAHASSVGALTGLFNPQGVISEQYRNGLLGNALGFDFMLDQNMPTFTAGSRVATAGTYTADTTTAGTWGTAGSSITSIALSTSDTGKTIAIGDTFTIAGVYAINPETQQNTGILYQFVATAAVASTTNGGAVTVRSAKVGGSGIADGDFVVASSASTASVTWVSGAASTTSPTSLAFHQSAFTLGTADLEIPGGVDFAGRESMDGISMRLVRQYDINSDFVVCRLDVLGGFSTLRPELALRIAG